MKVFKFIFFSVLLSLLFVGPGSAESLGEWIGGHARLAWVQDQGDGGDTFANGNKLQLYGYDSEDGKGERLLVQGVGNFFRPIFTPDGQQVIYSDRNARKMYLLDWETGKTKNLGSGVAVAVWQDTKPSLFLRKKTIWVYCFSGLQPENKYGTAQPLYRFPLHNPKKKELLWDKTNMAWSNVQLSRDGEVLGGLFPWPHGGILKAEETMTFKRFGRGCWTSLSPDNSKLLWIFDGSHRNVQIHDVENGENWKVNINSAPGINGFEVYHPRWSNHPRYFVMTGPYEKGDGGNRIGGGGEKVEIYVGRLDGQAKGVEDWLQVSNNNRADFYPDLWVEGGEHAELTDKLAAVSDDSPAVDWPHQRKNLVFVWEDMKAANQLAESSPVGFYQCNLYLKGNALFSRNFSLETRGGWGDTGDAGKIIGKALAESGTAGLEILVTPDKLQKAAILSFQGPGDKGLSLIQDDINVVLVNSLGAGAEEKVIWQELFIAGEPAYLSLSITGDSVELFKNGKSLGKKKIEINLKDTPIEAMTLGDAEGGWSGSLSHLAVYNTSLPAQDVKMNSQYGLAKVMQKPVVNRLVIDAESLETTEIPSPDSIGAYSRALVVNSYTVKNVLKGQYTEEKIVVAEWAVLDRQIVKDYEKEAEVQQLVLEKFDDHPELEGERQLMDIFEPDLTMFYRLN